MNPYCPTCGEDGDVFICGSCGKQKCSDCYDETEITTGSCKECLGR